MDPQIKVFDKFYDELLSSEAILQAPGIQKVTGSPSYNLMSEEDTQSLQDFLNSCQGQSLLEFGCGLSPCSQLKKNLMGKNPQIIGLDFSSRAIQENLKTYPKEKFTTYHQHIMPTFQYDHLVLTDALYQGSRKRSFTETLTRLLKNCEKSALIIQIHQEENPHELYPSGNTQKDSTESFKIHVKTWMEFIQREEVQREKQKFKLLWDTIAREMNHHWNLLEQNKLKRITTLYELQNSDS